MYRKLFVVIVAAVISGLTGALTDNSLSPVEQVNVAIMVVTSISVWATANVPQLTWAKALVAILMAGLSYVATAVGNCQSLWAGCLQVNDWIQVAVAAGNALLVYLVPNEEPGPIRI